MFTNCGVGLGKTSIQSSITNLAAQNATKAANASTSTSNTLSMTPQFLLNDTPSDCSSPFSGLTKLNFICIGSTTESYFQAAIEQYQQFLDLSCQNGQLFIAHCESEPNKVMKNGYNGDKTSIPTTVQWQNEIMPHLIENMSDVNYKPFEAVLNCGEYHKLESPIIIWPTPKVSIFDWFRLL